MGLRCDQEFVKGRRTGVEHRRIESERFRHRRQAIASIRRGRAPAPGAARRCATAGVASSRGAPRGARDAVYALAPRGMKSHRAADAACRCRLAAETVTRGRHFAAERRTTAKQRCRPGHRIGGQRHRTGHELNSHANLSNSGTRWWWTAAASTVRSTSICNGSRHGREVGTSISGGAGAARFEAGVAEASSRVLVVDGCNARSIRNETFGAGGQITGMNRQVCRVVVAQQHSHCREDRGAGLSTALAQARRRRGRNHL